MILKIKTLRNNRSFSKGETYTHSLTIIEGMNIYDIEKELEKSFLVNDCSY